jgi:hypothetical protein
VKEIIDIDTIIEIRKDSGLWADLRIINKGKQPVKIHNPGNYSPTSGWNTSKESYLIAVLLSFHFLEMKLCETGGGLVNRNPSIGTNADHIVKLPVDLKPSDELKIIIPIHEYYKLDNDKNYTLELTYGDNDLKVHAITQFQLH